MTRRFDAALQALGDPTRRQILHLLAAGPQSVGQISNQLPVTRPAVSHHLKVLKEAELVDVKVEGTRRKYGLDPSGLEHLQAFIGDLWGNAMKRFKIVAENKPTKRKKKPDAPHS